MKPITRFILTCGLTTLLLACDSGPQSGQQAANPAAPVEPADVATNPAPLAEATSLPLPPPGEHIIELSAGKVSVRANQVYALELLNALAIQADFQLLAADVDWKTVTVDIQAQPLHDALGTLLQHYPYQIVYAPDADTQQEVLSEVVIGRLPATGATANTDTVAAGKALPKGNEALSEDGQQRDTIQALKSPEAEVRAAAAADVEPVGAALTLLTDLLVTDPSPEVRIATAETLEDSDDPLAAAALVTCLQDEDSLVIVACIEALDYLGDETTVRYLEPLLTHYDPTVNTAASEAIESLR